MNFKSKVVFSTIIRRAHAKRLGSDKTAYTQLVSLEIKLFMKIEDKW